MLQKVEMTHDEKVAMYMKSSKKELIEMLINCNTILDGMLPTYTPMHSYHSQITCEGGIFRGLES